MKNIYIIPTQHFDIIWRKSDKYYRDVRTRVIKKTLQILREYPEYRFWLDQTEIIKQFIEFNPEFKDEMISDIKSGRFEICGGAWTLSDANMVYGESIVRNIMYGRQWLKKIFGIKADGCSFVDTFGMCGQLPQIIRKSGDDFCMPGRTPGAEGKMQYGNYGCFMWEGIDGSRVACGNGALGQMSLKGMAGFDGYSVMEGFDEDYQRIGDDIESAKENISAGLKDLTQIAGDNIFTDYTGEEHTPSEMLPLLVRKFNKGNNPYEFHISSPKEFYENIDKEKLPVIKGEFNPIFTGCYTTRIEIKKGVRAVENALLSAECLEVMACILKKQYVYKDIAPIWRDLNYAQFHDSICGCHIDESYPAIISKLNNALKSSKEIQDEMVGIISKGVPSNDCSAVVFNTLGFDRKGIAVLKDKRGIRITDSKGCEIPSYSDGKDTFFLAYIPASGFNSYRLICSNENNSIKEVNSNIIETCRYKVKVEKDRLYIRDKQLGCRIDTDDIPMGRIVYGEDSGNLWVERITGKHVYENYGRVQLKSIEENPIFFSVVYEGTITIDDLKDQAWDGACCLKWKKEYLFYKDIDNIDIKFEINWSGRNSTVMIEYPCKFVSENGEACYEVPFGSQKRHSYNPSYENFTGGSFPALNSADYSDSKRGLTVANNGTPSYSIADGMIAVTMVRSGSDWKVPFFPFKPGEGSFDKGTHEYLVSILPHEKSYYESKSFRIGFELNSKVITAISNSAFNDKSLFSLINIDKSNIILGALKLSEDHSGYILRMYEYEGKNTSVSVHVSFDYKKAVEANLMEESYEDEVNLSKMNFEPFEIKTIKLIV